MSLCIKPHSSTSTDRAVKVSVFILLPTVFGSLAIGHLLSTSRVNELERNESPRLAMSAIVVDGKSSVLAAVHVEEISAQNRLERPQHPLPVFPRARLVTLDRMAVRNALTHGHAPLEVTRAGQMIANPHVLAHVSLPAHPDTTLREELAKLDQVDFYGEGPDSKRRFTEIQQDVAAAASQHSKKLQALEKKLKRGERGRRRMRSVRGRSEINAEISATLFGTVDPFRPRFEPLKDWLKQRDDLNGLPLAMGDECRLGDSQAEDLQSVSATFRQFRRKLLNVSDAKAKDAQLLEWVHDHPWGFHHIPGLVQVLSAEDEPLRLGLVRILKQIRYPPSTKALARIAVFDLSAEVRRMAIAALQDRRPEHYREQLIAGLRYVWPPAAENAARTLVALDDRTAYEELVELYGKDDPRAPYQSADGHWSVRELIRVNHMRNCLLCHAPGVASNARVTGAFPSPSAPLPREYYQSSDNLVRADVTYLRQDFSVVHPVRNHKPWPKHQRFDYLVRERRLSEDEAAELTAKYSDDLYPQRAALMYALLKLKPGDAPASDLLSAAD